MNRKYLYLIAAALWGIPGVIIAIKGIRAYFEMDPSNLWWLLLITAAVLAGFFFMFRKIVDKYCALIASKPEKTRVWDAFPLRGWILIVFMMCLGMALKIIGVPLAFTASFYSGLGPNLILAACRFALHR